MITASRMVVITMTKVSWEAYVGKTESKCVERKKERKRKPHPSRERTKKKKKKKKEKKKEKTVNSGVWLQLPRAGITEVFWH